MLEYDSWDAMTAGSDRGVLGNPPKALRQPREGMMEDFRTTLRSDPAVMASHEATSRTRAFMHRSGQKKWCHRASLRSTSCSGKTTVPSGSTSNSGACANRASSGQLEDVRHPCITRGQWGGMPRPWRPTAGSCRRRQARAMKGRRTTLKHRRSPQIGARLSPGRGCRILGALAAALAARAT